MGGLMALLIFDDHGMIAFIAPHQLACLPSSTSRDTDFLPKPKLKNDLLPCFLRRNESKNEAARPPLRTRAPTVAQMKPLVGKPPTFTLAEADKALVERTNLTLLARPPPPAMDEDLEAFLDHPSINSGRLNMGAFKDALAYAGVTALEEMCDANIT